MVEFPFIEWVPETAPVTLNFPAEPDTYIDRNFETSGNQSVYPFGLYECATITLPSLIWSLVTSRKKRWTPDMLNEE